MATVSIRKHSKFAAGGDFTLWCKRFELYCRQAKIPEEVLGQELFLEDELFRVVDHLCLTAAADYAEIKKSLEKRYAPEGNELLWQSQFQGHFQKDTPKIQLELMKETPTTVGETLESAQKQLSLEVAQKQL